MKSWNCGHIQQKYTTVTKFIVFLTGQFTIIFLISNEVFFFLTFMQYESLKIFDHNF